MENLEQKFPCPDLPAVEAKALALGALDHGTFRQEDHFFPAPEARLKLRIFPDAPARPAELIAYRRANILTARTSTYQITLISNPPAALATLSLALGTPRVLKKTRHLLVYKHTRIHVDTVESLGTFCELETVFPPDNSPDPLSPEAATAELKFVIASLGLTQPIACAYLDLLSGTSPTPP